MISLCLKPDAVGTFPRGKGRLSEDETRAQRDLVSSPEGMDSDLARLLGL